MCVVTDPSKPWASRGYDETADTSDRNASLVSALKVGVVVEKVCGLSKGG